MNYSGMQSVQICDSCGRLLRANTSFSAEERNDLMGRPVVHFEIGCRDSEKTQEFYAEVFDWKIEAFGASGDDRAGIRRHERAHYRRWGTSRINTQFFMWMWKMLRRAEKGGVAGWQDAGAAGRDSGGNVCVVERHRWQHDWFVESEA